VDSLRDRDTGKQDDDRDDLAVELITFEQSRKRER